MPFDRSTNGGGTMTNEASTRRFLTLALAGSCLTVVASPLWAQSAPAPSDSDRSITVTGTRAVTATKTDTPLSQIPQSITVITPQQIKDQGALTMLQSTEYTAGATNGGDDTRGDFVYIRGFWAVNYLDGLKREFGFVYLPRSEVYTLDRIDVLLGPSAVLYGAGSSGGLVNMETKRPQFQFGGEATVSYGSYNRKQGQFDVTGPVSDKLALRLVGLYRDADSLVHYMPDDRSVIQPSLTWRPTKNTDVTLMALWQHDYAGTTAYMPLAATLYAPSGRRMDRRTLLGEPDVNRGPKDDKWLTLVVDQRVSDAIKFHSSSRLEGDHTKYGEIYGVYYNGASPLEPFIDANDSVVPRSIFAIDAHYRSFETDNNLQFDFNTGPLKHQILVGADYSWFRQLSRQAFCYLCATPIDIYHPVYGQPGNTPVFDPQLRQVLKDTGLYAQDQIRVADRASVVLGVRHDHLNSQNTGLPTQIDNATTFRAGVTVDIAKGVTPYASYSESFQPVSGLNQFSQSYKPLFGKSYEAGIKWQPVRGAMIRATYYNIVEKNHLIADPANPLNSIQAGEVKSKGEEIQVNYALPHNFSVTAAYAHNSTIITGQHQQQDNTPKDTVSIFGTKTVQLRPDAVLRFGGGVRHVGSQVAGTVDAWPFLRVVTPDFTLVDAMAAVDFRKWTIQLNALNLTNKYYYAACAQYGSCTNGDPRTFNIALTRRF